MILWRDCGAASQDAFAATWYGRAESDSFNKLLLGTQLTWREVALLRAYARYMKQTGRFFPRLGSA